MDVSLVYSVYMEILLLHSEFCCACDPCAHAQVVKRVVGLYGDGSIKPFSAVEGLEADYVHRCCSTNYQTLCVALRWRDSHKIARLNVFSPRS